MDVRRIAVVVAVLAFMSGVALIACDGSGNAVKEQNPTVDSGGQPTVDSGGPLPGMDSGGPTLPDGAPSDCYLNPTTHLEIINACTDAVKITKNPTLPLLYPDGGLPPLP
jgi:hypothetical protein